MCRTVRENKKRHINGPDNVTSTDRGRNSYAKPPREPSETLIYLCNRIVSMRFDDCKGLSKKKCSKMIEKLSKWHKILQKGHGTDTRGRVRRLFCLSTIRRPKPKKTKRTQTQTGQRRQPNTAPSAAKSGRMLTGKSIRAWQRRPGPITENAGAWLVSGQQCRTSTEGRGQIIGTNQSARYTLKQHDGHTEAGRSLLE